MKTALIVLFVGLASCGQLFSTGQEYEYQYYGRLLTGIPQLDSTYAGLALKGRVLLQATSQNDFKLQMKDVSFGTYNERLSGPEPNNWRSVDLEANTPVPSEYKQMLESPVEFQVRNGEIYAVKLNSQEPTWSVNMKKALISSLKIQLPQTQLTSAQQEEQARNPRFWYVQQQQQQQGQLQGQEYNENQYYWTVMEEGIEGKCENTYQVSELPEYMIHEYEQGMINTQLCQGQKYWQVLRTRDITKCQDSAIFLSSRGHKNCLVGNCESENTKQTQTRYFGCGESVQNIQLHGMINEGEMRQSVVAFNVEQVVTGTKQVLKLQQIRQVSNQIPEVQSPRTCHDLTYEYPQMNKQSSSVSSRQNMREIFKSYSQQPKSMAFVPEIMEKLSTEETKTQIVQKIQQIAQQLEESDNFAEKEIPTQLKSLKVVLSVMKTEDIKEMFQSVNSISGSQQQKLTCRNLFFDLVRNAGTPSTVMFIKEMIEQNQFNAFESYLAITTLSHYIKAPTEELIHQIFQLIKSPSVQNKFWLKGSAHLVFANIVRNACLGSSKNVYPEQVFGKMCSANNNRIVEEYIPHLVQDLKNAQTSVEKQIALYALGQLAHESVIPLLVSYVEGKTQDSSVTLRKNALWALSDVAHYYRQQLLPVALAIAHNPAESRSLRIPAISMIMKQQPETVQLQKLAVSTWFEQDQEVARYIYSTLKDQAYLKRESHPEGSYLYKLSQQAQTVLPLAKPVPMILPTIKVYSGYLPKLEIGAYMLNSLMTLSQSTTEFYHKTEYFLKQVQTTPVELAFHVAGMSTIAKDLLKTVTSSSESVLHPQLKELIQRLEITPREDSKFELGAWLRLSDDINFAAEINHETVTDLKRKVLSAIKDSGLSVMSKICGKTPINHQNVFEELPYQAVVPSDLGLPILVESQMTYFYSVQGELNVECSFNKPSASLEVASKMSYTYNGYAGTVSPFTQELLAAGINIHRATNLPVKTIVEFEPSTSQMKIAMTQNSQVSSNSQGIDVHNYSVKPYVARKPIVFKDLTPAVTHHNTKIIRSPASPKSYEFNFGQSLGLDMSVKVETECDVFDAQTMIDSWSNFNYNPVAAQWFFFTESALTAQGMPSARYHSYSVVHNPSRSSTKAAEMTVQVSLASKVESQEPRKYTLHSSQGVQSQRLQENTRTEQRLGECLRKVDSKIGYAINAQVNAKLIGGQPKTYTYSITAGSGHNSLKHKWNLQFENEQNTDMKKLCVDGQMQYPTTSSSDAHFKYSNKVAFGNTCDQYYVNVEGQSLVSNKQRQFSTYSIESEQCHKATQELESLKEKIQYVSEEDKETRYSLEKKHSEVSKKMHMFCNKKRDQSRALDKTEFTITTSQELPTYVYNMAKSLNTAAKAVFFQYISKVSQPTQQNKIQVELTFNQKINSVSAKVQSPRENVVFENIRIPYELQEVVPFVAGKNPLEQSYKAITGKSWYPKCTLGQGYVQTFDKKSYTYQIDECDHLIASDCSKSSTHAVLAKEVNGLKHITIYQGQSKVELRPAHAYSGYVEKYVLTIDGQEVQLIKNEKITLKSSSALEQITAFYSNDNTVEVETPYTKVTHFGKTVSIEEMSMADGNHCGLCGDYNLDKRADIKSSKGCVFSSNKLAALSYRSKSSQCKPLSQKIQEQIRTEESKCVKYETKNTHAKSIFDSEVNKSNTIRKHTYIFKEDKICISQEPVAQCTQKSMPMAMKKKTVKYVCLPEGRVAQMYAERIERGESPQELRHQPVAFKVQQDQPISCRPRKQ